MTVPEGDVVDPGKIEEFTRRHRRPLPTRIPGRGADDLVNQWISEWEEDAALARALLAEREEMTRERDRHAQGAEEMRAKVALADRLLGRAGGAVRSFEDDVRRAEAGREEMLAVLRKLEWSASDLKSGDPMAARCPLCHQQRPTHFPDCRLAALLGTDAALKENA